MVFLFPGIIFRKFYFSGKFSKQFGQGNLLERFLWTLFCSIISLTLCSLLFYLINEKLEIEFFHNIDFAVVSKIFECLSTNKYPTAFTNQSQLFEIGLLLISTYCFSAISGFFCLRIVRLLTIDTKFSTLKFSNDWFYLTQAVKSNGVSRKFGDEYYTSIDILIIQKDKEELYTGVYKEFIFDKDHKVEHIVLSKAAKFITIEKKLENQNKIDSIMNILRSESGGGQSTFLIHKQYDDKIVFKKNIVGHLLILPTNNASNINITYVKVSNRVMTWKIQFLRILLLISNLLIFSLTVIPFLKINNQYYDSVGEKIVFVLTTICVIVGLYTIIKKALLDNDKFLQDIALLLFVSIPYLWVYEILPGYVTIIVWIFVAVIVGRYLDKDKARRQRKLKESQVEKEGGHN